MKLKLLFSKICSDFQYTYCAIVIFKCVAIQCTPMVLYIYVFILTKLYIESTLYSKCSFMEM